MADKKRQHIVPQFLQRSFATSSNKNIVRIYSLAKDEIFNQNISANIQSPYFYGESGVYEEIFAIQIELPASVTISNIIENPAKYMEENQRLSEEILNFLMTLKNRSVKTAKLGEDYYKNYFQKIDTTEQSKLKREKELREFIGKMSFIDLRQKGDDKIFNGKYLLVETEEILFLPDEILTGFCPLSPHLLLVYGDIIDCVRKVIQVKSKNYLINLINKLSFQKALNVVIVGETTNLEDIRKLNRRS